MILHPGILSLSASSLLISVMVVYAALQGIQIQRRWDLASGSELQLMLERRTYLVSTVVSYFLGFQLVSLFMFIYTADSICALFVGAMCAVGTLSINPFGYLTLVMKVATFLLAGFWLILNHADSLGYDYPLIRTKYLLLTLMAPLILIETVLQGWYFLGLKPDIITSCCGSLFSPASRSIATEIANAPPLPMLALFYVWSAVTFFAGLRFLKSGRGGRGFAFVSVVQFVTGLIAIISVFSLYIYQMPSHHCPFCILQKEYGYVGYPIYLSLLTAGVCGFGAGWLSRYGTVASLTQDLPTMTRTMTTISLAAVFILVVIVTCYVLFTSFTLR